MDHYQPLIPVTLDPITPYTPHTSIPWPWQTATQLAELQKVIADFKEAVEAAKTIDRLTGQPDCEDPEKMKLIGRVAELERQIEIYKLRELLQACVDAWDSDEEVTPTMERARAYLTNSR